MIDTLQQILESIASTNILLKISLYVYISEKRLVFSFYM